MRKTIILHHYTHLHLAEEPIDARHWTCTTTLIFIGIICMKYRLSVVCQILNQLTDLCTFPDIIIITISCAILKDEQIGRISC
ncbi:MAG: hypothetical protein K6F78_00325 [Bacteroidaceae bacterium]|nr:hypothetical protein [Bacteroidaceae bacterium]